MFRSLPCNQIQPFVCPLWRSRFAGTIGRVLCLSCLHNMHRLSLGLGGPHAVSDLALVGVRRAAELTCAAEAQRATVLNGGNNAATLDALIKLEGEARRAVRALGLKLNATKPHRRPDFAAVLCQSPVGSIARRCLTASRATGAQFSTGRSTHSAWCRARGDGQGAALT